jgi:putative spermidine/putrescine transport system permease protein
MTEFSLSMRRGEYSLRRLPQVLADPRFQATFSYSV